MVDRFYVYELSDPRSGRVFYVGKGCGRRAYQHEANTRNGRVQNAEKHRIIADILKSGFNPVVTIIDDGLSEQDAYKAERERIRHHGYKTLTNIMPGTMTAIDRSKLSAKISLDRLKPHNQWLCERPRSDLEIALAERVRSELATIAQNGYATEITISKHGLHFR